MYTISWSLQGAAFQATHYTIKVTLDKHMFLSALVSDVKKKASCLN